MRYFRLATDCILVQGEHNGAIYDIHGCRVFLLDRQAHDLLRKCECNEPLSDRRDKSELGFLEELQDQGLGYFDAEPAYIDKFLWHQPIKAKPLTMQPPDFLKVDWAITNQCDLNCNFCGREDETISWQSCQTCLCHDREVEHEWKPARPEHFINEIEGLGIRVVHIRGGNPLLVPNYLQQIVQSVRHTSLDLVITTPGTGLDVMELIDLCRKGQVKINIVMFGLNDLMAEAVCGHEGVLRQQLTLISALTEAGIPFFITFLLTQPSLLQRQEALEFMKNCCSAYSIAETHFRVAMGKNFRLAHVGKHTRPLIPWQSVDEFLSRAQINSCLSGRFEIGSDGMLRSCAGNPQVHGNIATDGLHKALSRTLLYNTWALNKDRVRPCKHCELRYACIDCSVFELRGEHNLIIKEAYCPHQPRHQGPRAYSKDWSSDGFIRALRMHDFYGRVKRK